MNTGIAIIHPDLADTLEATLSARVSEVFYSIEQAFAHIHQARAKEEPIHSIYASEHLSDGNGVDFVIRAKALLVDQPTMPSVTIIGARTSKVVRDIAIKRGVDQWVSDVDELLGRQAKSSSEADDESRYEAHADVDEAMIREIANDEVQDAILDHGTIMLMASKDSAKQMIAQSEENTANRLLKMESLLNRLQTKTEQDGSAFKAGSEDLKFLRHNLSKLDDEFHVLRQSLDQLELQIDQTISRQYEQSKRDEKATGLAKLAITLSLLSLGSIFFLHFWI